MEETNCDLKRIAWKWSVLFDIREDDGNHLMGSFLLSMGVLQKAQKVFFSEWDKMWGFKG